MASYRSSLGLLVTLLLVFAALQFSSRTRAAEPPTFVADSVSIATPPFVAVGKRYAFTWAGGGPAQTYTIKGLRSDGWVLVEVADENTHPINFIGDLPTRWLNVGLAISIQEMRPHQ